MALYHLSIKNHSRHGASIIAAAAYRSCTRMHDGEQGMTFDYTKKSATYTAVLLPPNAPREWQNRERLWSAVQAVETASDARLAREFEISIPNELSDQAAQALVTKFAESLVAEGMCVDLAIHKPTKRGQVNHHAHLLTTTRPISSTGQWETKEQKRYALDANGNKIPLTYTQADADAGKIPPGKAIGDQKIGAKGRKLWKRETVKANDLNAKDRVDEWRQRWSEYANDALAAEQHPERVDHRSYKAQGLNIEPHKHKSRALAHNPELSRNAEIDAQNAAIDERNEKREKAAARQRVIDYYDSLGPQLPPHEPPLLADTPLLTPAEPELVMPPVPEIIVQPFEVQEPPRPAWLNLNTTRLTMPATPAFALTPRGLVLPPDAGQIALSRNALITPAAPAISLGEKRPLYIPRDPANVRIERQLKWAQTPAISVEPRQLVSRHSFPVNVQIERKQIKQPLISPQTPPISVKWREFYVLRTPQTPVLMQQIKGPVLFVSSGNRNILNEIGMFNEERNFYIVPKTAENIIKLQQAGARVHATEYDYINGKYVTDFNKLLRSTLTRSNTYEHGRRI